MKKTTAASACLIAFICASWLIVDSHPVQAASGTVSTEQPVYSIWGIGGAVRVTVQNLQTNVTYYLWMQRPGQKFSSFVEGPFVGVNASTPSPIPLAITPKDPPGTYLLSLSTSGTTDTREAVAHFGVMGTDSTAYERTKTVTIAGGGFAANSTISLDLRAANSTFPGFPVNVSAKANGEFTYTLKLSPSAPTGTLNVTAAGLTFDQHIATRPSSFFTVTPTRITAGALREPAPQVERTVETRATYRLSYADGSPVTVANGTADVISDGHTITTVPLLLVNSTSGEWRAAWSPPPSANLTAYSFQFNPAGFTDAYGNTGQGSPVPSSRFNVLSAKLQLTFQASPTLQRTQTSTLILSAKYPNGANAANITQASVIVTRTDGNRTSLVASVNGTLVPAHFVIPVNASLGNWTLSYAVKDLWGNSGSGISVEEVQLASPRFELETPATTERTTFLNATAKMYYPDGSPMNSTTVLVISHGNETWSPALNFNSTTKVWLGSLYIVQNATLGPYNITWSTNDEYGNGGNNTSTSVVIPARFRFLLHSNNSTVEAFTNLDLNVTVSYPNGTSLTNSFGNVTGSYTNATGALLTLPLAYNQTENDWHMFFSSPEEGNITFSFSAIDRFGNAGNATDAYNLKVNPSQRVLSQRLIIAGVIGALVPVALLIWAITTISTRRRKHRP